MSPFPIIFGERAFFLKLSWCLGQKYLRTFLIIANFGAGSNHSGDLQ
jgi:hypothetical protein